jgi:undecaprenyl-diphosphatase
MTLIQAIILGIVQGLTEFIPVSSSAHLVLVPAALGWSFSRDATFVFDVLVQMGTLLAVIVYFRRELIALITGVVAGILRLRPFDNPMSRLGWLLVLATSPAVVAGLLLKDLVEQAFSSPIAVCAFLLITALWLTLSERSGKRSRDLTGLTFIDALWIGLTQVMALFPGISRSGATIGGGLTRNMDRASSARFAFLMSIPVMLGAGVIASGDLIRNTELRPLIPPLAVGFVMAAIVGYVSIRWLLAYLSSHSLRLFAAYCAIVGVAGLVLGLLHV